MQKIVVDNVRFRNFVFTLASLLAAFTLHAGTAVAVPGGNYTATLTCEDNITIPPDEFDKETRVRISLDCSPGADALLTVMGLRSPNEIVETVMTNLGTDETDKAKTQVTTYSNIDSRRNFGHRETTFFFDDRGQPTQPPSNTHRITYNIEYGIQGEIE